MANVSIQNLGITLGGNAILRDLTLAVEPGEFLVLLGPSGCGKSTLLHAIAGLIDVSSGSIEIAGQDMTDADPSERNIGMVFQSYALYPTMSVEKNMSFGLRISGIAKDEIAKRIAHAAQILHLEPLLKRKPSELSGGQRQRVAIGRALVRQAAVYLFDEPLSNLDAKLRSSLRRELKLLHQQLKSTMIYVTHDQVEAMTLASRIVVMRSGEIQQIGTPAMVYEQPANQFVAGFLGSPAMNFISGDVDSQQQFHCPQLQLDLSNYAFKAGAVSTKISATLGVRAEQIKLHPQGAMEASVSLVEPMGNHQVLWLEMMSAVSPSSAAPLTLAAIANDGQTYTLGQQVHFDIDTTRVSLFDPDTELRL